MLTIPASTGAKRPNGRAPFATVTSAENNPPSLERGDDPFISLSTSQVRFEKFEMATELCTACSTITLSMLVNGFQHPLDYDHVVQSASRCRLCDILKIAYGSQICIKHDKNQTCDTDHHSPLLWRLEPSGPGARWGIFKLDSQHYGDPFQLSVSEGRAYCETFSPFFSRGHHAHN